VNCSSAPAVCPFSRRLAGKRASTCQGLMQESARVLQRVSVKSFQGQAAQAKDCAIRTAVS
jgi:hypothetical protein